MTMINRKITRYSLHLLLLLVVSYQPAAISAPPEGYNFYNLTKAMEHSSATKKPMLLYFGRYGCSTCRKMHKEVFSDASLNRQFQDNFILAYVDTESDARIRLPNGERTTEMQFAASNRIQGTPTFIYFSADQKPLFKKAGFQTVKQMSDFNTFVAEGHYQKTTLKQFLASR
jgi:thioredoxin-related protein